MSFPYMSCPYKLPVQHLMVEFVVKKMPGIVGWVCSFVDPDEDS